MELNLGISPTADQVCALEPGTGKVYVFVEPTPEILGLPYFDLGKPDEHQGAHCISFVLSEERAVDQSILLTQCALETHKRIDQGET